VICPTCQAGMFVEDPIWGGPSIFRCHRCLNELPLDFVEPVVRGAGPAANGIKQNHAEVSQELSPEAQAARFEFVLGNCAKGTCGG
jgi:hypothetical protein